MAARQASFKYSGEQATSDPAWRVVIAIGPSRLAMAWISAIGTASIAATLAADLHRSAQAVIITMLACALVRALRLDACREGKGAVVRVAVDPSGRLEAVLHDGAVVVGRLQHGSFVAPWLTIVVWRPDGKRLSRTILVAPDAVDREAHRRLRILLRWR